jgi:4-amino-4-deoxy-L-arabinose transferase-like glycosyltransferase
MVASTATTTSRFGAMLNCRPQWKSRLAVEALGVTEIGPAAVLATGAIFGVAAFLFFFHLGRYGLWDPDEGRYAEISREMLATGNFIVPHLNYVPYIEKPPLLYWLNALAMRAFGMNEFAARLVNAFSALYVDGAVYYFTQRVFDRRRAQLAALILATSILYAVMAQVVTTDLLLTAALATSLFAAFLQWRDGGRWGWLFYAAMGCSILAKGPVGIVLPVTAVLLFCWWEGNINSVISRFKPFSGLLLTAVIAVPWFIAIMLRAPGFFDFYFVGEHVRRFFQSSYSHNQPIYFYVPIVAAGMLPWTLMVPLLPWRRLAPHPARRFCLIAAGTVFVLFSLASAKLVPYIMPLLPLLAIVIADGLSTSFELASPETLKQIEPSRIHLLSIAALALTVSGAVFLVVAAWAPHLRSANPMLVRPALYAGGVVLIIGGILSAAGFRLGRGQVGLSAFALTGAALILVISYGRLMAEPARSYAALARTIEQRAPDGILVCYPRYIQSLPFYCRRRVILVGARTELAYGADHSPDASKYFFAGRDDLLHLWAETPTIVLIIDRSALPPIQRSLGQFLIIASDMKKLVLIHAEVRPARRSVARIGGSAHRVLLAG